MLSDISDITAAVAAATNLIDSIREPIRLAAGSAKVGTSVDAAVYPANGGSSEAVIAAADRAMSVAKSRGKNECVAAGVVPTAHRQVQEYAMERG